MFPYLILVLTIFPLQLLYAGSGTIISPVIYPASIELFVSPDGNDTENVIANADFPLRTFDSIFSVLKKKTIGLKGDIYCSVFIKKGIYHLQSPFEQFQKDFSIIATELRKLHVSLIGINDSVVIDGSKIKKNGGYGLIRLCGSNILIKNITIKNASSYGIVIGQPFARSTNVLIENVHIDSTFSHGLLIGDINSKSDDTVLIRNSHFTETNQMNALGNSNQWGSALKLFGAGHIMVDSCYFEHNWSEAISINNSRYVKIIRSHFINNFAPSVYCDIARNVTIEQNMFIANADSVMYKKGKRGMVAILLSSEAWDPLATDHKTSDIDIFSNIFLGQSGVLDLWEGTVSFLQTSTIENVRCAFNSSFGMSSGNNSNNTGIISTVFSSPIPFNRSLNNILIYGNIFSVDPLKWPTSLWFRAQQNISQKFTFIGNRWNAAFPSIGNYSNDDTKFLPDTFSTRFNEIVDLRKKVAAINECKFDYWGRQRGNDSTFAGAFEFNETLSILNDSNEIKSSYLFAYFPNSKCNIPKDWNCSEVICLGLKGELWKLKITERDEQLLLPGNGPYFLYPQSRIP